MGEFGEERNQRKAGVRGFKGEVALGLSIEGRAEEQSGLKARIKTGVMGKDRGSIRNWARVVWHLGC